MGVDRNGRVPRRTDTPAGLCPFTAGTSVGMSSPLAADWRTQFLGCRNRPMDHSAPTLFVRGAPGITRSPAKGVGEDHGRQSHGTASHCSIPRPALALLQDMAQSAVARSDGVAAKVLQHETRDPLRHLIGGVVPNAGHRFETIWRLDELDRPLGRGSAHRVILIAPDI
jgi:hypothetical protein